MVLLTKHRITHRTHPYAVAADSPNYGALVAAAIGVPPGRVFKTLIAEVAGALTVAIVPVTGELDLKALAAAVGGKRAKLAERGAAERATGYVRGRIRQLGPRKPPPTVPDDP
ncbi:Cys-tRNA(Pro) deacylase, partial [Micromonospora fiedleri]|nr:Cys-tRNA(Pro) deacylase [Micromonospora fiedleri]